MDTSHVPLLDLSPVVQLLLVGALLSAGSMAWVWLRQRRASASRKWHAVTLVAAFLTIDLVLFGAFTRLTDSGLGCPDWPGCYGSASPLGAHAEISAAQAAMPTGPVTHSKAWIEMVHRYLATAVGGLVLSLAAVAWWQRWRQLPTTYSTPWLPTASLIWVCVQGAFGAFTVTMKLFPAIVTLHLLGGYALLALLVWQVVDASHHVYQRAFIQVPSRVRWGMAVVLCMLLVQAASGAWVSTNYAVLACDGFPLCQGTWWPAMDFVQGFTVWRPLGLSPSGDPVSFQALTAIHMVHRILAVVTVLCVAIVAMRIMRADTLARARRCLIALLGLQVLTGLSNVILDWPLLAAVLHTGGAGAMVAVAVWVLASTRSVKTSTSSISLVESAPRS
jgi:heme a synthase